MGYQDRDYSRSEGGRPFAVLNWLMTGSVPLFRVFGIQVRMHAVFLIFLAFILLFGFGPGTPWTVKLKMVGVLWSIVLLHEFGHCFGARWTGGSAELITLNPMGGLAYAMAAHNPFSQIITVIGGPLVNVIICVITGTWLYAVTDNVYLWPSGYYGGGLQEWLFLIHFTSLALLYFNLLPIFPLDGGQLLQSLLWKPMGYYRSMWLTIHIGLVGSIGLMLYALLSGGGIGGSMMLFIGLNCLLTCIQWRVMLKNTDPFAFEGGMAEAGYERALQFQQQSQQKESEKRAKRRQKEEEEVRREQQEVDAILAKVGSSGMNSLSGGEKKTLAKATENQRRREVEREKTLRSKW